MYNVYGNQVNKTVFRATVAARIEMSGQGEDLITIYAGSTEGKVLKLGISDKNYGEVMEISEYFYFNRFTSLHIIYVKLDSS